MILALISSSTGKFRSGSTNVDSWLPILSCALGETFAAQTGESSCETELDGWHSAFTNWNEPFTAFPDTSEAVAAALEFCRDSKSSCYKMLTHIRFYCTISYRFIHHSTSLEILETESNSILQLIIILC